MQNGASGFTKVTRELRRIGIKANTKKGLVLALHTAKLFNEIHSSDPLRAFKSTGHVGAWACRRWLFCVKDTIRIILTPPS